MELVAYNSDGTLPTNQVYDDIVTDVTINAPEVVDITNDNHATMNIVAMSKTGLTPLNSQSITPVNTDSHQLSSSKFLHIVRGTGSSYQTSAYIFDESNYTTEDFSVLSGIRANISVDISEYLPNTVLVIGDTSSTSSNYYCFINTSNKSYSSIKSIILSSNSTVNPWSYESSIIYYDGYVYLFVTTYSVLKVWKLALSGDTFNTLNLSNTLTTNVDYFEFTCDLIPGMYIVMSMAESGYPDKVIALGMTGSSYNYSFFSYYTITLGSTVSISSINTNNVNSGFSNTISFNKCCKPKYLPSTQEYFFVTRDGNTYNSSSGDTGIMWAKFRFNGSTLTNITYYTPNKYFIDSAMNVQGYVIRSSTEIICMYYYGVRTSEYSNLYALYINTESNYYTQLVCSKSKGLTNDFNPSGYYNDVHAIVSNHNVYITGELADYVNKSWNTKYQLVPVYPYYDNEVKLADYGANSSTKALAVTSGNIGDTVRIAYEGTYHVPGVPTGSIYNTDTSYAIAKKSGVLTVSEPQQTSKVYYGSYVGDGTRGLSASNPMSITFPFEPKAIWMFGYNYGVDSADMNSVENNPTSTASTATKINLSRVTETFKNSGAWRSGTTISSVYHKLSSDRKTYYWYTANPNATNNIFNRLSNEYWYIAFG